MAKPNATTTMYQAFWRKALKAPGGELRLELPSPRDAQRERFALYNATRAARKGDLSDPELAQAVEQLEILLPSPNVVMLRLRRNNPIMQSLLEQLGEAEREVAETLVAVGAAEGSEPSPEQLALDESLRKVLDTLAKDDNRPDTPYYSRKDGE